MDIATRYPKAARVVSWKKSNSMLSNKEEMVMVDDYEKKVHSLWFDRQTIKSEVQNGYFER